MDEINFRVVEAVAAGGGEWRTDYMSLLEKYEIEREEGRAEGREEGRAEGRAEGRVESREENAKAMLKDNMDVKLVVKYSGLPESQVLMLKASLAPYEVN